jgi:hypothetical protein
VFLQLAGHELAPSEHAGVLVAVGPAELTAQARERVLGHEVSELPVRVPVRPRTEFGNELEAVWGDVRDELVAVDHPLEALLCCVECLAHGFDSSLGLPPLAVDAPSLTAGRATRAARCVCLECVGS